MAALKTIAQFFVLINIIQVIQLLPIESESVEELLCSTDEITAIINEQTNLLDEKNNASSAKVEQLIDSINKIADSREYRQLLNIVDQSKKSLGALKEGLCTNESVTDYDLKLSKIDATILKCTAGSNKKQLALKSDANSILTKITSSKTKASAALQKCSSPKSAGDCATVTTCCSQALLKSSGKVDLLFTKTEGKLEKAATSQNGCLKKAAKEMLSIEAGIKEELLECSLLEPGESGESGEIKTTTSKATEAPTTTKQETQPSSPQTQTSVDDGQTVTKPAGDGETVTTPDDTGVSSFPDETTARPSETTDNSVNTAAEPELPVGDKTEYENRDIQSPKEQSPNIECTLGNSQQVR